jgi:glycosyltransferase involved in cell wall biosynthesis
MYPANLAHEEQTAKHPDTGSERLKVLVYTSLFPNSVQPLLGNFILERTRHLQRLADLSVVAPVPFFPPLKVHSRWYECARVPRQERLDEFELDHPRFVVVPKMAMPMHGISMFAGSARRVFQKMREQRFDLIDAHYVYPDGLAAVMLGKLLNIPVVVSARGSDINQFPRFRTIRPLIRRVLKGADAIIAVSQGLKETMAALGCPPGKIEVIGNGVDSVQFRPAPRSEMRKRLGLPPDSRIVLAVGKLARNKGFHILIDSVARLRESWPDIMLVIVGEGPSRTELERQVRTLRLETAVKLVGGQPHESLAAWYNAADVFCLASLSEGCPNVVLEAMACGLPVVATSVGAELVVSPSLGILTQRTPDDFQTAIEQAFLRTWDRDSIVAHARTKTWNEVASRVLAVFTSVARPRVAPGV